MLSPRRASAARISRRSFAKRPVSMKIPRASLLALSWAAASASAAAPKLPSVDVGYNVYGAASYDVSRVL